MSENRERPTIEGKPAKSFAIYYCDINNEPFAKEAEYDSVEEIDAHRYRLDRRYKIWAGGRFVTRKEHRERDKLGEIPSP